MTKSIPVKALDPLECRFTDPQDVAKYGERWYTYDESTIVRMKAKELIKLESEIGYPLVSALNGYRRATVFGETFAAWYAVRLYDAELAGDFEEFEPFSLGIIWRIPEEKEEKGKDGSVATQELSLASLPHTNSVKTDTVALPVLPVAGSNR